jgi:hypothetical protein
VAQEANGLPKELEEEEEAVGEGVAVQDVTKEAPTAETTKSPGKEKEEENKEEVAEEKEEKEEAEEGEAVKVHPMFAPKSDVTAAAAKETATGALLFVSCAEPPVLSQWGDEVCLW